MNDERPSERSEGFLLRIKLHNNIMSILTLGYGKVIAQGYGGTPWTLYDILNRTPTSRPATKVAQAYAPGSGSLKVLNASVFGSPSVSAPLRLSVYRDNNL